MPEHPPSSSPGSLLTDGSLDDLLAFAQSKFSLEFEPISVGGMTLQILQIADMRERLDTAIAQNALDDALNTLPLWAKIWPASIVLGHVLGNMPTAGRTFLEIGAGCGVTGLVAASLGFERVVISDVNEDALLFARINILKNGLGDRASARRANLRSDSLGERFSVIAGSEILYLQDLYSPLVDFLDLHLARQSPQGPGQIFLATDHRRNSGAFFHLAAKKFTAAHKRIGIRENPGAKRREQPERHLFNIHRLTPLPL